MYPPDVGVHAEDLVLQQWKRQVREQQAAALTHLATLGLVDSRTTSQIAVGSHRDEAMDDIDLGTHRGSGGRIVPGRPVGQGVPGIGGDQDRAVFPGSSRL
jgi:hypothetical protein